MILSMTGFSSRHVELPLNEQETLSTMITFKATNARFFEVSCKTPHVLSQLEPDIIRLCKKSLRRGSIQCSIYCANPSALKGTINASHSTIQRYLHAIDHMQDTFKIPGSVTINDIINLPHVFETTEQPLDTGVRAALLTHINTALEDLLNERTKEGSQLQIDLEARIAAMQEHIVVLEERAQIAWSERKERLTANLHAVSSTESEETKDHHTQMIYSQLDKIDIHEEIVRFKSHIDNFIQSMHSHNDLEKGKKLDFILQELFRETNTIAAKCADSQLSERAINIKVELEKAREQVQNII